MFRLFLIVVISCFRRINIYFSLSMTVSMLFWLIFQFFSSMFFFNMYFCVRCLVLAFKHFLRSFLYSFVFVLVIFNLGLIMNYHLYELQTWHSQFWTTEKETFTRAAPALLYVKLPTLTGGRRSAYVTWKPWPLRQGPCPSPWRPRSHHVLMMTWS